MAQQEPMMPTTCDYCKKSRVHPRRYCSIACEEGRGRLPMDSPESPDYHLYLKGEPQALVGKALVAKARNLVDYSPDWCRNPEDCGRGVVVSHDRENQTYVRKDDVVLGVVYDYDGHYHIEHENMETGQITHRRIKDMLVVDQIRRGRWWVDG